MILATWILFDILMLDQLHFLAHFGLWNHWEKVSFRKKKPLGKVFFQVRKWMHFLFFCDFLPLCSGDARSVWSFPDGETTVSCRHSQCESPFSACYLQLLLILSMVVWKLKEVWLLHYFLSSHFQLMMNYYFSLLLLRKILLDGVLYSF